MFLPFHLKRIPGQLAVLKQMCMLKAPLKSILGHQRLVKPFCVAIFMFHLSSLKCTIDSFVLCKIFVISHCQEKLPLQDKRSASVVALAPWWYKFSLESHPNIQRQDTQCAEKDIFSAHLNHGFNVLNVNSGFMNHAYCVTWWYMIVYECLFVNEFHIA